MLTGAEIRHRFLAYFAGHDHAVAKSDSLVPASDQTLLFTNAGMVQFKGVFLGTEVRPYRCAATVQRCLRVSGKHNDLDSVGVSQRHHTFFEMLGSFSFGGYFKREAIELAWGFLTGDLGVAPDRLMASVYEQDDESHELWREIAGLPAGRLIRLAKEDSFWEVGDTGPCGPCSEIHWDRGPAFCTCGSSRCSPATQCDRWLELWNLVFMQYESRGTGRLDPLPQPSVDTGMGLERVSAVMQGVQSNYETDLFLPIMRRIHQVLGLREGAGRHGPVAHRVIADHSRAIAFLAADGVFPANEGRGYVLRMLLRRACRFGRHLGFEGPFLAEVVQAVVDAMGHHYTELCDRADYIRDVVTTEEARFLATLTAGLARLKETSVGLRARGALVIPGDDAFRLYDAHGFPLEVTRDAAAEEGLRIDEAGFQAAMARKHEQERGPQDKTRDTGAEVFRRLGLSKTEFCGHDGCSADVDVLALARAGERLRYAEVGEEAEAVLSATPFYATSGGQVGDTGELRTMNGRFAVYETASPVPDLIVHYGRVVDGRIMEGERVRAEVDQERQLDIARNHTATHLLHRALRNVLGEHAVQAGSLVAPDRLRFDFCHPSALTMDELRRIEAIVNQVIREDLPVAVQEMAYDDAVRSGAVALFDEKYGQRVRVVAAGRFAAELCGGTHVLSTGRVGHFHIVGESSVGAGLRRIEAVTGRGAELYIRERLDVLRAVGDLLGARPGEEMLRAEALMGALRLERRAVQDLQRQVMAPHVDALLDQALDVSGAKLLAAQVAAGDINALRAVCDRLRDRLGSSVVALGAVVDGRPLLVVGVTPDLVELGLHAGQLAHAAAARLGGGGGGKPAMGQAGGKDPSRLADALSVVEHLAGQALGQ